MFMGPFEQTIAWSEEALVGPRRFLEKVWRLQGELTHDRQPTTNDEALLHSTIKKVSGDIENMKFNTAISSMMIFVNELEKEVGVPKTVFDTFLRLLAP